MIQKDIECLEDLLKKSKRERLVYESLLTDRELFALTSLLSLAQQVLSASGEFEESVRQTLKKLRADVITCVFDYQEAVGKDTKKQMKVNDICNKLVPQALKEITPLYAKKCLELKDTKMDLKLAQTELWRLKAKNPKGNAQLREKKKREGRPFGD